jgi:hypothetical protein
MSPGVENISRPFFKPSQYLSTSRLTVPTAITSARFSWGENDNVLQCIWWGLATLSGKLDYCIVTTYMLQSATSIFAAIPGSGDDGTAYM